MPLSPIDPQVVCTTCGCVYSFPPGTRAAGCPQCSGLSWVSARLTIRPTRGDLARGGDRTASG